MRIPSDYQVNVTAPRAGLLEALGLRVGQIFTGEVVNQQANGSLQLLINGQTVSLKLPIEAQLGQILQFEVRAGGAKPELTFLGVEGDAAQSRPAQPPQAGMPPRAMMTETAVTRSLAESVPAASGERPAQAGAGPQAVPPQPAVMPQPGYPAARAAAPAATAARPGIALPPQLQATLNLQPGQLVSAEVVPPTSGGQPQISINGQILTAPLPGIPPPGAKMQLQADFSGAQPRLVVPQSPTAAPGSPPPGGERGPPASAPITPATVHNAVAHTIAAASARQDTVGTLIASLAALEGKTTGLPPEANAAAQRLLSTQINLDRGAPGAEAMRDAVLRSGLFLEAALARGAPTPTTGQDDMKALLLVLRNALGRFVGPGEKPLPPRQEQRPPPPMRGQTPRAPLPQSAPPFDPSNTHDTARHLLSQTDSALARTRLFQLASLPDPGARAHHGSAQEWRFELPFVLGNQLSMAQFQVSRDGGQAGEAAAQRGWQMIFAINLPLMGEVGARVSFRARKAGAVIWAETDDTADMLEAMLPDLVAGLEAQGLETGAIHVRRGPPDAPPPTDAHVDAVS